MQSHKGCCLMNPHKNPTDSTLLTLGVRYFQNIQTELKTEIYDQLEVTWLFLFFIVRIKGIGSQRCDISYSRFIKK